MAAIILDGKAAAARVLQRVQEEAATLKAKGVVPGLATVLVGVDPASAVYVGQKIKTCEKLGLRSIHAPLPGTIGEADLIKKIHALNNDPAVHGIIVQLPLPKALNADRVLMALSPAKDADGLHPLNQGRWVQLKSWRDIEQSGLPLPCTPAGVMELLAQYNIEVTGRRAVVVGRSTLVGKPLAFMLLAKDATVTLCHSRTKNLAKLCREADILVAALGVPKFIKAGMVKKGAVVVDVGISRTEKGLVGDVDYDRVKLKAKYITPVPGGVGPMTVALLLWNTVLAAKRYETLLRKGNSPTE